MTRLIALAAVLATGFACTNNDPPLISGQQLPSYWGLDGTCRSWEFLSSDTTTNYAQLGVLQPAPTLADDGVTPIHTVEYRKHCIGEITDCVEDELVWSMSFSASPASGTLLYAFDDGSGERTFSPPIAITDREMNLGDTITTSAGGGSVTAEFMGLQDCNITWANWPECAVMHLSDDGAGTGFAGDLWIANGWGLVAFQFDGQADRWALERGVFTEEASVCETEGLPLLE